MQKLIFEVFIVAALLCVNAHFVQERIDHKYQPGGDEGSWMSVAAELCRGNGFSTRCLEHVFLTPATLPRPDDYRYPALSTVLAGSFRVFGISYGVALWTVAAIFFLFLILLYLAVRSYFGRTVALLTLLVSVVSLNLLYWSIGVGAETLFGVVVGCIILASRKLLPHRPVGWIITGALCGLLYLVRPNGILFLAGALWLGIVMRKSGPVSWKWPAIFLCAMLAVMTPWLLRTAVHFGNPFHIAGSAGLLRVSDKEPLTLSLWQFLSIHGALYPIKAFFGGLLGFFRTLDFHEHGLEWLPLFGVLIGVLQRRRFYNRFVAAAFLVSFCACAYASFASWSGVRYFTAFLPFVYGFGIASLLETVEPLFKKVRPPLRYGILLIIACVLVAPVFYPHKYFERSFGSTMPKRFMVEKHFDIIKREIPPGRSYFAAGVWQWNFMATCNCVCVQDAYDSSLAAWALDTFTPSLLVASAGELSDPPVSALVSALRKNNCSLVQAAEYDSLRYFRIVKTTTQN